MKLSTSLLIGTLTVCLCAAAQETLGRFPESEIALLRADIQTKKTDILQQNLALSDEQAKTVRATAGRSRRTVVAANTMSLPRGALKKAARPNTDQPKWAAFGALVARMNPRDFAPKNASRDEAFFRGTRAMSLTYPEARTIPRQSNECSTR